MRIDHVSRYEAERLCLSEPYVHICITDPGSEPLERKVYDEHCLDVLRLHFWDLEEPCGKYTQFFTRYDAKRIRTFVEQYQAKVDRIVVSCEAGISRSCAVAAALSRKINGDDARYFKSGLPNSLVYRLLREELYLQFVHTSARGGQAE